MKIVFRIFALLPFIACSVAYAQPAPGGMREACGDDVHTFCNDVKPGGGRIIDCLEDHYKALSDACSAALQNAKAHRGPGGDEPPPPPPEHGDDQSEPPPAD